MDKEIKQGQDNPTPPAGGTDNPPAPNPTPSVEELQKQNQEFQTQLKERDAKIADLSTSVSTMEERLKQINTSKLSDAQNKELHERAKKIMQNAAYDPDGAAGELTSLLTEIQAGASKNVTQEAQRIISTQIAIDKLRNGIRTANPDFDDDVVDTIMQRANILADTGKYKTAQEAIDAATQYVKEKFDSYAKKKNATPPLPDGARAENGANKPPTPQPKEETLPTPLEETETRKVGLQKKIL